MARKTPKSSPKSRVSSIREIGQDIEYDATKRNLGLSESVSWIQSLARCDAEKTIDSPESLRLFLMSWWSGHFKRPLKDPLLLSYSLEELLYEFFNYVERTRVAETQLEYEDDKIEDTRYQEALDWAEAEEHRELEQLQAQAAEAKKEPHKPTKDDLKWMKKQIKEAQDIHGEDFGEDIKKDFE